jgi:hypothetical protein
MTDHKITNLANPISDNDASNKKYVKSEIKNESIITKLYIDTLLHTKLDKNVTEDLNMNNFAITNVKKQIDPLCADLKLYVQVSLQKDDVAIVKLLKFGEIILDLFNKYKHNIILNNYRSEISTSVYNVATMISKYSEIFDNIFELPSTCNLFLNLKVIIIKIIEMLPEEMFLDLKKELMTTDLISTPEDKTLRKKYRRFINKNVKLIDPARLNKQLELLVQKNLLLIDFGFVYFINSLLEKLLAGS